MQPSLRAGHDISTAPLEQRHIKHRTHNLPQQEDMEDRVGIIHMVMLVSAMFGIEACIAFDHIYLLLMLQYLGTPVSLMSTCGVFTGITSLLVMPGLSYFVNRGNDSWKRKWYSIISGLTVFLVGLILLITAGIIKIIDVSKTLENASNMVNSSTNKLSNNSFIGNFSSIASFEYERVPTTAILGIVGFGLTDMAYDLATPAVKSFVLDTLPTHQHNAVLATSTVLQGLGGTAVTLIGVCDLPAIVGYTFKVDGIAGTLLLLCGILVLTLIISFSITLISGKVIGRWMAKRNPSKSKGYRGEDLTKSSFEVEQHEQVKYRPLSTSSTESCAFSLSYANRGESLYFSQETQDQQHEGPMSFKKKILSNSSSSDEKQCLLSYGGHRNVSQCSLGGNQHSAIQETKSIWTQTSIGSHLSGHNLCESVSAAVFHGDTRATKRILRNKRVIITCISCFFANGCLLCFSIYSPNALTIGIYKGDPLALPGLPGRELYEKGMRLGAVGILLMYTSTFISSEKRHYLIVCCVVVICIATFVGTQNVVSFFVAMMVFGSFRSCCLTTPFVIVSKIVSEEIPDNEADDGKTMGSAISLLGMMMPSHYLVLSSAMGPLIDASNNVWVPIIYSIVVLLASAASLALLRCVHPQKE